MKATIPILTLLVGAVIGWSVHNFTADSSESDIGKQGKDHQVGVPAEVHDEMVAKLRGEISQLKKDVNSSRSEASATTAKNTELLDKVKRLEEQNEMYANQSAEDKAKKTERMGNIEKRFKALTALGAEALMANNEIGKLVADLLQEGERGQAAVMALLNSSDEDEKMLGVVLLLQGMASVESIDPLTSMALDENGDATMKAMASQVLLRMDDEEAIPALEKIVAQTKDEGVKVNSLFGLARQGHQKGIQDLLEYYNDPKSLHQDALTGSFLILRNPEAQPLIDAVVDRHREKGESTRNAIGEAAISYYGHVKTPQARKALENIVNDPTASSKLRQKAQDTLNKM